MSKKLNELFDVAYGNKFDLNKLQRLPRSRGGVSFVGRSSKNNGIRATVATLRGTPPYPSGLITVALGGAILSSFVQEAPFYTAQNVAVLKPKSEMSFADKVYVCLCIRHNRFRYRAFGREANRTIPELLIPARAEFPTWLADVVQDTLEKIRGSAIPAPIQPLSVSKWKLFSLSDLFDLRKGKRLVKADRVAGLTPCIGALDTNNGLVEYIDKPPLHPANTMTVVYNGIGGVGTAFYQPLAYWCSDDVNALYPRFELTPARAMFLATVIRMEKYRYSFGRKWHLERMAASEIRLPATPDGNPDWDFIEQYIKTLPCSSQL